MTLETPGLHHVTAIAGDPQDNADFYVGTLGLRMVKRTVNHDDTGTYHFYFGDHEGTPGTNITFFPWASAGRHGDFGAGQTETTAYLIRPDSVEYWIERLEGEGVPVQRTERFDETVLRFEDPDGIGLELVATDAPDRAVPWPGSPVPERHQLRGFYNVTLAVGDTEPTAEILTDVLGYERVATDEATDRHRYRSGPSGAGAVVDLVETDAGRGRMGVGTVHHVAFEVADVDEHNEWRETYAEAGLEPTEVIDRKYFQSIYVQEPGGILFEMATPEPGFAVEEDVESLGSSLVLPKRLESDREAIEAQLPSFDGPPVGGE
jgi:glyoxalase family protein